MNQTALAYNDNVFMQEVSVGLSGAQKSLSCKYLYDAAGSDLFERICTLEEYYPTRTELAILKAHIVEMAHYIDPTLPVIELGAGAGIKTKWLLEALPAIPSYVPVDISPAALADCVRSLSAAFAQLRIKPVMGDYMEESFFARLASSVPATVFFPGSTLGNLDKAQALSFLHRIRRLLGAQGGLLLGIDLMKDENVLRAAYNDREGVTAAFNKNVLTRINRELGADFDVESFRHDAIINHRLQRVEMHLVSLRAQTVRIGEHHFYFRQGETIHTENSHKYTQSAFAMLAEAAGLSIKRTWTDERAWYAVHYLTAL